MIVTGISAVRNEEDVIEAFVRHTLTYCDDLIVLNHGSTDATLDILQSLQREGLRLHLLTDNTLGNLQTLHANKLLQMAVHDFAADWVACLDADEFLQGPFRESLLHSLENGDNLSCRRLRLLNYRVHLEDDMAIVNPVERIVHYEASELRPKPWRASKLITPRGLALKEGAFIEQGNHQFTIKGQEASFKWMDESPLAHFSIRRPSQFGTKLVSYIFQRYGARGTRSGSAEYALKPYQELRRSYSDFAENFHRHRATWVSSTEAGETLIRQPAQYRGGTLCYTSTQHDTDQLIRNILDLGESFANWKASEVAGGETEPSASDIHLSLCDPSGVHHVNPRTYPVQATSFSEMPLSLEGLVISDRICIGISGLAGILEISEIIVRFKDAASQTIKLDRLQSLLSVNENGLKVSQPAAVRFLMNMKPIVVTLADKALFSQGTPSEVILQLRQFTDLNRRALATFDASTIEQLHLMTTANSVGWERYSIGKPLSFSRFGVGSRFFGTGWSHPQNWGTWSLDSQPTIHLRLDHPTTSKLALKLSVRRRKDHAINVEVLADGSSVGTWELKNNHYHTIEIALPASPWGRSAVDIAFHVESSTSSASTADGAPSLGIEQLCMEEVTAGRKALAVGRRLCSPVIAAFLSTFRKNRITLGEEIDFRHRGRGVWFLGDGWGAPSPTGCLIMRDRADLTARLARRSAKPLVLRMLVRMEAHYWGEGSLSVEIGGKAIALWTIPAGEASWFETVIPQKSISEGVLRLALMRRTGNFELEKLVLEPCRES